MKLIITLDTEGDNQWSRQPSRSVENIRSIPRFQQLCDRFDFKPTYLCTYDVAAADVFEEILVPYQQDGVAEIGAHLHPWATPPYEPFWDASGVGQAYPSELPLGVFARKLAHLTDLLRTRAGVQPRSYRAGRWGLSAAHIPPLLHFGYIVDCSVTPLVDWQDTGARERGPDFSRAPVGPYFMAWGDPSRAGASGLLEVPVTIVHSNSLMRRSVALRAWHRRHRKSVAARLLNRLFWIAPQWFRPFSDMGVDRLTAVYRTARRLELPVLQMMFHSSELMPGASPHNPTVEGVERLYERLERIFVYLKAQRVEGVTLSAFAETMRRGAAIGHGPQSMELSPRELTWAPEPDPVNHHA